MEILTAFSEPHNDPGRWFLLAEKGEERLELLIRHVPSNAMRRIIRKHLGTKLTPDRAVDLAKSDRADVERGVLALVDSQGFEIRMGDEEMAARYSSMLGGPAIAKGELVKLDGRWTDAVREEVLWQNVMILNFVLRKSSELSAQLAKEEEFPS